jgi:DNA-binding response OmpR family regulator
MPGPSHPVRSSEIAVVDAAPETRRHVLGAAGYDTVAFDSGAAAWREIEGVPTRLLIADLLLPDTDGF